MREVPSQHTRRSSHDTPGIEKRTEDFSGRTRSRLGNLVQRSDGVLQAGRAVGELDESFGRLCFGGVEDYAGLRF